MHPSTAPPSGTNHSPALPGARENALSPAGRLRAFRRLLWRTRAGEWASLTLSGCVLIFGIVWLSDRFWNTPPSLRLALLLVLTAGALVSACWLVLRWGVRLRHPRALGRHLRSWDRRTGDRILAALELSEEDGTVKQALRSARESAPLREAALRQLSSQLAGVDLSAAISRNRLRRFSTCLMTLTLLGGALVLVAPGAGINALQRSFLPWKEVARYTFVQVARLSETQVVPHAEPATLQVPLRPDSPWKRRQGSLRLAAAGTRLSAPFDRGRYTFQLPPLMADETLHFSAGDARATIRALPRHRPGLESLLASTTLPAYLGHPVHEESVTDGVVKALPGSQVHLAGTVTRALAQGEIHAPAPISLSIASDSFRTREPLRIAGEPRTIRITWQDHLGLTPREPLELQLVPVDDQPPHVTILLDRASAAPAVLESETLSLALRSRDDFGVQSLGLVTGPPTATPESLWTPISPEIRFGDPQAATLDADAIFSPRTEGLAPGHWRIWAFALDYRPDAPPAFSAPLEIRVLSPEEHAALIRGGFRRIQEDLETIARREAELMHANQADARGESALESAALEARSAAESANANALAALAEDTRGLLAEAMKNDAVDAGALEPWSAMLGTMNAVASQGMPGAAKSMGQAAAAAAAGSDAESRAALDEAIAREEENLRELAAAMNQGHHAGEQLEAATFINRLRQAASAEEEVATRMGGTLHAAAGLAPDQLPPAGENALAALVSGHDDTRQSVADLIGDLGHYHRRTGKPAHGAVHREMETARVPEALNEITTRLERNQHGRVIRAALEWGRRFHAWADALAAGQDSGDETPEPEEGSGESEGQMDAAMMLAIMRLVQREMTLREQTRAVDARAQDEGYTKAAETLAGDQRAIAFSVAGLVARALGPELQARLRDAARAMDDASALLDRPETGGETIAAESEAIELLAAAAKTSAQVSGNSRAVEALEEMLAMMEVGNSPGGNPSGNASALASESAPLTEAGPDGREARRVRQTAGFVGGDFPEEFREALGHFFERREDLIGDPGETRSP